jgi:glutamine amidotransferase
MSDKITIIDYGVGNIFSIRNALMKVGVEAALIQDPDLVRKADRVIMPGVGAFKAVVDALDSSGMKDAVADFVKTGKPLLGICVGMQMLMSKGEEFGLHDGLGYMQGTVRKIPEVNDEGIAHKVPHIQWSPISAPSEGRWNNTCLSHIENGEKFYFVHSFAANAENENDVLANTHYNGVQITAAIQKENITGLQFHPERSAERGLSILKAFSEE